MSLSTKLNLMKLKSSSNQTHRNSASSSSPMPISTSVPIFTFKNEPNSEESAVSIVGSRFSETTLSEPTLAESTPPKPSSLSTSPSQSDALEPSAKKPHTSRRRPKNIGAYDSNEEDSPESSGDEYVHTGFVDEENKIVET